MTGSTPGDAPSPATLQTRYSCRVEWGHCDPAGIVFYPVYFQWMDAATWAHLEAVGYGLQRLRAERRALPLVAANCDFTAPASQGEHCELVTRIVRFGTSSIRLEHQIQRTDGKRLATGTETRVWGRMTEGGMKAEPITQETRALFLRSGAEGDRGAG